MRSANAPVVSNAFRPHHSRIDGDRNLSSSDQRNYQAVYSLAYLVFMIQAVKDSSAHQNDTARLGLLRLAKNRGWRQGSIITGRVPGRGL